MKSDEIVAEIIRLSGKCRGKWDDGDWLSKVIIDLASLISTLGETIIDAELEQLALESEVKLTRESIKLDELEGKNSENKKRSGTYADSVKVVETQELQTRYLEAYRNWKRLQTLRTDTNNLIDAIRSRLSFIKGDMQRSNIGQT
jgi:hypothetical protein